MPLVFISFIWIRWLFNDCDLWSQNRGVLSLLGLFYVMIEPMKPNRKKVRFLLNYSYNRNKKSSQTSQHVTYFQLANLR